jgi:hypothetical protein
LDGVELTCPSVENSGSINENMRPVLYCLSSDDIQECDLPHAGFVIPDGFLNTGVESDVPLEVIFVREG